MTGAAASGLTLLAVTLAGGVGATLRFVVDGLVRARTTGTFPVATMIINVSGSLLLGLLTGLAVGHALPEPWHVVAGSGLLGGYTTFSAASAETVRLLEDRRYRAAALNGLGMLAICAGLAAAGYAAGTALAAG